MENEIKEKYLPVGTVVLLKGGKKRIMITGFCASSNDEKEKIYDYSGCLFPEGIVSSNQTFLFDHNQIDKVYHMGLEDDEEKEFKVGLKQLIEKVNQSQNNAN